MELEYQNSDGTFDFKKARRFLTDVTDGYLSNLEGVGYKKSGALLTVVVQGDGNLDITEVASSLLSTISSTISAMRGGIGEEISEKERLHRAQKFASSLSQLSDRYAMMDDNYQKNFHDEIITICECLMKCSPE